MYKSLKHHSIYFSLLYLVSYILYSHINIARISILIISLYMLITKRKGYTSLFIKIKALLVFIPIIGYLYHNLIYKNTESVIFTTVLVLNVLEASVLLGLKSGETLSKIK